MVEYAPQVWSEVAAVLRGEVDSPSTEPGQYVLRRLGCGTARPAHEPEPDVAVRGDAPVGGVRPEAPVDDRLVGFAARLVRVFEWPLPDAPGGIFIGAEADPEDFALPGVDGHRVSMGAADATFSRAFQRCVGEGVEYLSQIADGTESTAVLGFRELTAMYGADVAGEMALMLGEQDTSEPSFACVPVTAVLDERRLLAPADLCLRRSGSRLCAAASTGCAAGPTFAHACLSGLLELVERDAAALWWVAGRPARHVPLEVLAAGQVVGLLDRLRASASGRRTFLLDITSDVRIPVVAAVSVDGRNRGFACGLGAAFRIQDAALAALLELCQLELAVHVVRLKLLERGPPGLNETDRAHLRRSEAISLERCQRFWARGAALDSEPAETDSVDARLRYVAERVAEVAGCSPILADLTRAQFGVAVAKVLAPGLQLYPATVTTARLQRAGTHFGGSLADCVDIGLL
jgi:ribosomal protein S12 methylthiotransferase accessory factor